MEIPTAVIHRLQSSLCEATFAISLDDAPAPSFPSVVDAVATFDSGAAPVSAELRCVCCGAAGGLLRGAQSALCAHCGCPRHGEEAEGGSGSGGIGFRDESDAVAQGVSRLRGCRFGARHLRRAHVPPQEPCVQRGLAHRVPVPSLILVMFAVWRAPYCWIRAFLWNIVEEETYLLKIQRDNDFDHLPQWSWLEPPLGVLFEAKLLISCPYCRLSKKKLTY